MDILVFGARTGTLRRLAAGGFRPLLPGGGEAPAGVETVAEPAVLWERLPSPRFALLDLAGAALEEGLAEVSRWLEPGDVLLDPSPSWWCDTLRRARRSRHRALHHLDLAELDESGAARLLVGGTQEAVDLAAPVLDRLAPAGGWRRIGSPGAAHFARALAEAVRTVRALAHGEAVQLAEAFPGEFDGALARRLWPPLAPGDGREAWVPDDAVRLEAAVPVLAQAVMLRIGERLDEHASVPPPPRFGPFLWPEEPEEGAPEDPGG